jgi:hypothetical protein
MNLKTSIFIPVYVLLISGFTAMLIIVGCERQPTLPRQPFPFSHQHHVTDYNIDCEYCHSGVRSGSVAGIPSVQTCMGCHQLVAATSGHIMRLRDMWERGEPVRWMRVNVVADFVYFDHFAHINADISCEHCHGDVARMDELLPRYQLNSMSWCVDCHNTYEASKDCMICHR